MVLRAKKQLILVKIIDFTPLVPQKLSVESSINDCIQQKSTFTVSRSKDILFSNPQMLSRKKFDK